MVEEDRRVYEALRAGHVAEVRAALMDHVARLDWPAERTAHYRTERLRALLVLARARSPFHAERVLAVERWFSYTRSRSSATTSATR